VNVVCCAERNSKHLHRKKLNGVNDNPCADITFNTEGLMDVHRRVFRLIQMGDWYWRLDITRDDGLIGPFPTRDEAEKDARETLGIKKGER
jgi:hypothetical protein